MIPATGDHIVVHALPLELLRNTCITPYISMGTALDNLNQTIVSGQVN